MQMCQAPKNLITYAFSKETSPKKFNVIHFENYKEFLSVRCIMLKKHPSIKEIYHFYFGKLL